MFRTKVKGKPSRKKASDLVNCEPDFYSDKFAALPKYDSRGAQERLRSLFGSDEGIRTFLMSLKQNDSDPPNVPSRYHFIAPPSNTSLSSVGTDTSKKRSNLDLSSQSLDKQSYTSLNNHGSRKKLSIGSSMKNLSLDKAPPAAQNAVFHVTEPSNIQHGFPNNNMFLANHMGPTSQLIPGLNNEFMGGVYPQMMSGFSNQASGGSNNIPFYIGTNYMNMGSYDGKVNPLLMGIGNTTNPFLNTLNQQNASNASEADGMNNKIEKNSTNTVSLDWNPTSLQDLRENDRNATEGIIETGDDGDLKDLLGLLNDSSH
jgi:hypothetical protein